MEATCPQTSDTLGNGRLPQGDWSSSRPTSSSPQVDNSVSNIQALSETTKNSLACKIARVVKKLFYNEKLLFVAITLCIISIAVISMVMSIFTLPIAVWILLIVCMPTLFMMIMFFFLQCSNVPEIQDV